MHYLKWLRKNTSSLKGKRVVITGATGGLGKQLCFYLAFLGADLVLINRNIKKAQALKNDILKDFSKTDIILITADFENMSDVNNAVNQLKDLHFDVIIYNAGVYAIKKEILNTGFLNVYQTNFLIPFYMTDKLFPFIKKNNARTVVVGSIAHRYSKSDFSCIDFRNRNSSALIYGNSKRHLMFAFNEYFKEKNYNNISIVHPGISFTGITDHYPPWLFKIIKRPMKIIFMKPIKASLCILKGVFENTESEHWFSPLFFGIWGTPVKRKIDIDKKEKALIYKSAKESILKL